MSYTFTINKTALMGAGVALIFLMGIFIGSLNPSQQTTGDMETLLYASIGASLVAALSSIVCLMQVSRRIA